jgi:short-subunit dehydrogenase
MSWAVVTGASGGIGFQMVKSLAAQEPNIHFLLVARREDCLKKLQDELKAMQVKSEYLVLDLTQPDAPKKIEDRVRTSGYAIRHLINNAGFGYYGRFDEQSLQNVEEMIALIRAGTTNVISIIGMAKAAELAK